MYFNEVSARPSMSPPPKRFKEDARPSSNIYDTPSKSRLNESLSKNANRASDIRRSVDHVAKLRDKGRQSQLYPDTAPMDNLDYLPVRIGNHRYVSNRKG